MEAVIYSGMISDDTGGVLFYPAVWIRSLLETVTCKAMDGSVSPRQLER